MNPEEHIKELILKQYANGNIVFRGVEGFHTAPLAEFIKQSSDGILYDLNRNEVVVLTFIDDPKWVNDFAVAKVIHALKERIAQLEAPAYDGYDLQKIYDWVMDENRPPAQTHFTASIARNIAKEMEFRIGTKEPKT